MSGNFCPTFHEIHPYCLQLLMLYGNRRVTRPQLTHSNVTRFLASLLFGAVMNCVIRLVNAFLVNKYFLLNICLGGELLKFFWGSMKSESVNHSVVSVALHSHGL